MVLLITVHKASPDKTSSCPGETWTMVKTASPGLVDNCPQSKRSGGPCDLLCEILDRRCWQKEDAFLLAFVLTVAQTDRYPVRGGAAKHSCRNARTRHALCIFKPTKSGLASLQSRVRFRRESLPMPGRGKEAVESNIPKMHPRSDMCCSHTK
jgi:hypothetical protein